ncbi:hypothetical protein MUN88_04425 [Gracilibacillus caseinilyticus]|uniref:L-serine ammonia-lyase n=1 Tax=Gracilibacillus caseinilyticus TaxID=2932256 RepID=A0ABY4EYL8_9BACI|nr:serine dehydratase beta chain [Gracilibacillus caseinilyticus]UOQ49369.1 hypothetical protein MUN88_04425 [Gracilibacillus caseinilyticus]
MEFNSCFDIIGPIMVGPSSSHTAGVVSIGKFIYDLFEEHPDEAHILFCDSFAETYQGHGTDKAVIGGLMGMGTDDSRIKNAFENAYKAGMKVIINVTKKCDYYDHPNTVIISAKYNYQFVKVGGVSLGGGVSKIFMINEKMVDIPVSGDNNPLKRKDLIMYDRN